MSQPATIDATVHPISGDRQHPPGNYWSDELPLESELHLR